MRGGGEGEGGQQSHRHRLGRAANSKRLQDISIFWALRHLLAWEVKRKPPERVPNVKSIVHSGPPIQRREKKAAEPENDTKSTLEDGQRQARAP